MLPKLSEQEQEWDNSLNAFSGDDDILERSSLFNVDYSRVYFDDWALCVITLSQLDNRREDEEECQHSLSCSPLNESNALKRLALCLSRVWNVTRRCGELYVGTRSRSKWCDSLKWLVRWDNFVAWGQCASSEDHLACSTGQTSFLTCEFAVDFHRVLRVICKKLKRAIFTDSWSHQHDGAWSDLT